MNAIATIALSAALLFLTRQCGKEELLLPPECLQAKIHEISSEDVWNPPAKIYSYAYNGQTVYFIPQHCCDIPSQLYDANCNLLCNPDGGFTAGGDGKCPDFFSTRTDEKLLWEDPREN
jgi:hypothetical protein